MRAREPDVSGRVVRGGVEVGYEVFGDAEPTLLLLPTWSIVHSWIWKGQVAPLARHRRVITFDGRGNGSSSQPTDPQEYGDDHVVADALAVLDATQCFRWCRVARGCGGRRSTPVARSRSAG